MFTSHIFRPRTSVYSRNAAIDFTFICLLYRGRVAFNYKVLYIVTFYAFTAFSQYCFYSLSAHLVMYIVDLHLYQQPPILCCLSGALPALCCLSACCYSNSYVSCSFSIACRRRVSWLVSLGVMPLWGALVPYMRFSVWRISFSTGWFCTVDALCIAVASIYTFISGTAASRSSTVYSVLLQVPVIFYKY